MQRVLLLCLVVCGLSVHAQDTIRMATPWSAGDTFSYQVSKVWAYYQADTIAQYDSISYALRLDVDDSTATGFNLTWQIPNNLTGEYNIPNEYVAQLSAYVSSDFKYTTDTDGRFSGITNANTLSDQMGNLLADAIVALAEDDRADLIPPTIEGIIPNMDRFSSQSVMEEELIEEIQLFHVLHGQALLQSSTIDTFQSLNSYLGDFAVLGDVQYSMTALDTAAKTVTMTKTMSIDPSQRDQALEDYYRGIGVDEADIATEVTSSTFSISDNHSFELNYQSGVANQIVTTRSIDIQLSNQNIDLVEKIYIIQQ